MGFAEASVTHASHTHPSANSAEGWGTRDFGAEAVPLHRVLSQFLDPACLKVETSGTQGLRLPLKRDEAALEWGTRDFKVEAVPLQT